MTETRKPHQFTIGQCLLAMAAVGLLCAMYLAVRPHIPSIGLAAVVAVSAWSALVGFVATVRYVALDFLQESAPPADPDAHNSLGRDAD